MDTTSSNNRVAPSANEIVPIEIAQHRTSQHRTSQHRQSILGFAVLVLLLAASASAQWSKQSPTPTHLGVGGIAAPTPNRVFLATDDDSFDTGGALFESNDGGITWMQRNVPFSLASGLHGIFFLDDQHGWTWGNVNYRTTDGGTTWTELPVLGTTYVMRFFTASFGLATGNASAFISGDGGLTWTPSPDGMFAFDFADDGTGLGVADTGIYRTGDGGVTFSLVQAGAADAVAFLSPTVAVAIVDGAFARSTDGGITWTVGDTAVERNRLLSVSASVVLAWGRSGSHPDFDNRILRSVDSGQTWTDLGQVIEGDSFAVPFAFAVPDAQTVVASNGAGDVYQSVDAGATWSRTFASPGPVPSFLSSSMPVFTDSQTGYFGFGAGFVIKTLDSGATWEQISSGAGSTFNDLDRFANGNLIAVGDNGTVVLSTGSAPWRLQAAPTTFHLQAVQVVGPQEVVALDETARVYRSADGGTTWTAGAATPASLDGRDLFFTTLLDGWVTGFGFGAAAVFHTADGGDTWTPVPGFLGGYVAIDFAGARGWAANVSGPYYRTVDSGATWIQGNLPGSPLQIRDMDFFDASVGYAVGWWGYAVRSADGGATWQVLPTPDPDERFTDIYLLGADELWLSTTGGKAYYSATGGQTWAVMTVGAAGFGSYAAITASPVGDAWMAGGQGLIQHFAGPPPLPLNRPPAASYDFVAMGLSIACSDTSSDPDGIIVSWLWDFGDGTTSAEQHPTHVFSGADTYHVRLTVTDDDGATGDTLTFIAVQPGPGGTFGDFTEVTPLDPLFVTPQDEDFWVASTAPADFDGDGDLDIAVLGFYVVYNTSVVERLVLIRNDGAASPTEWEFAYIDAPLGTLSVGASDLAWGDVDGDGDQDLVVGSNGQTVIYRNDAGTLVASDTVLPPYWEDNLQGDFDLRSITWADYDNDGDIDLLLPSVWDASTFSYRTALMRNDGANGTDGWIFTEVAAGFATTEHAQSTWADFDGDQDLDLLLVHLAPLTNNGFIRRYRNDGNDVFVGEDILGTLTIEHGEAQWGDYDDDGDLDILVAGHIREVNGSFNRVLRIYRNDAETYVAIDVIACPICEGWLDITAAAWADYDSDGDVDILVAGNYNSGSQIEGRAKVYNNQAGVFTDSGSQLPAPRASGSRGGSFTWLDMDGEGDLDYFIAGQYFVPGGNGLVEAQMHVYRNDTQSANSAPSAPTVPTAQVDGNGTVMLWWNPAFDDFTPSHALTYDLRLYRSGIPVAPPQRLPEHGKVSAVSQWSWTGLPDGVYTWTVLAVDSAYNSGPAAEGTFTIGVPDPPPLFADGFESGDLSAWSITVPLP